VQKRFLGYFFSHFAKSFPKEFQRIGTQHTWELLLYFHL
jgi:hypothetical protein